MPLGMFETYAYDAAGNLTNRVDFNGRATSYAYDTVNRLLSKTPAPFFASPPVTFAYTPTGQRATMSDASGFTSYSYNSRDWLTNRVTPQGTLSYTYDEHGNVTRIRSSNANGVDVSYSWDALNRPGSVTDPQLGATSYAYDDVGNLAGYTYPNGVSTSYEFDALNRLTNLVSSRLGITLASYRYSVASTGHRLTVAETVALNPQPRTLNRVYTYDAQYRLTAEHLTTAGIPGLPQSASVGYILDAVGNRLARTSTLPGVPHQSFNYDANDRLVSDSSDANGNTTLSAGNTDQYDFEDRLISRNNGQVVIVYDGDGNRVRKTVAGVTTLYLVDERNPTGYAQVLEELISIEATPEVTRVYVYGLDLVSQDQFIAGNWVVSFYGADGHGNTRLLTASIGQVTDTYDYDGFGMFIAESGTTPNAYLYKGAQFDSDLALYYLRARYLLPTTARFWTRDPFERLPFSPASLHNFSYAQHDPINNFDPTGFMTIAEQSAVADNIGTLSRMTLPRAVSASKNALGRVACAVARIAQRGPIHHIFTNQNFKRGQKFSKQFEDVFKKAGLDLDGWYNKIQVPGHAGPHAKYNEAVKRILDSKLGNTVPGSPEYVDAVLEAITDIVDNVCNKQGHLYKLLVK